ncbi:YybH family protein [Ohtaekwangia koreensis]|uniref:Ketosteroid isomerase homolog n=1 Tax=Ohtaekwangia koreensis TaxID=688867 RepID=A0A1T5JRS8_9BACT|nr:nuclear transport factor 2 family protein [Ohtaekwangia koreensis]SKC53989.1 Ketosteroid isomerase homolog [Ohtaekwangia koreensis]
MSTQDETQAINTLIDEYGKALNTADSQSIIDLYSDEGLFFPNHYRTINKHHLISKSGTFLKNNHFSIVFEIKDVVANGEFAFVQSTSTTTVRNLEEEKGVTKTSRDLFVLRKEQNLWKIYRYIFNDMHK